MIGSPPTCRRCYGQSFRRSTRGVWPKILRFVGLVPYRCRSCQRRVWRFGLPWGSDPDRPPADMGNRSAVPANPSA